MNVTLSIPDRLVEDARRIAQARGLSLNQMIRDELERLAGTRDCEAALAELRQLWAEGGGNGRGQRWSREELHDRALLR